jgi:hypothetical protein
MSEDSAGDDLALTLAHDEARARVRQGFHQSTSISDRLTDPFPQKRSILRPRVSELRLGQLHPGKQRSFDKFRGT